MKTTPLILIVALFVRPLHGEESDHRITLSAITVYPDKDTKTEETTTHEIGEDRAIALPKWGPESGGPIPMPVAEAVKKARLWMAKHYPGYGSFDLTDIGLLKIQLPDKTERWYYSIGFEPTITPSNRYDHAFTAVVLFDGTVVEPAIDRFVRSEGQASNHNAEQPGQEAEQPGPARPATQPADKEPPKDQPSPPTSKVSPR